MGKIEKGERGSKESKKVNVRNRKKGGKKEQRLRKSVLGVESLISAFL